MVVLKSEREYHDEEVCGKDEIESVVEEEVILDQKVAKIIESKTVETTHVAEEVKQEQALNEGLSYADEQEILRLIEMDAML